MEATLEICGNLMTPLCMRNGLSGTPACTRPASRPENEIEKGAMATGRVSPVSGFYLSARCWLLLALGKTGDGKRWRYARGAQSMVASRSLLAG